VSATRLAADGRAEQSLRHLLSRVGLLEARIRGLVAQRQGSDPQPDDPFRGLYLSDEAVARLLARQDPPVVVDESAVAEVESAADAAESDGATIRLRQLTAAFGLEPIDVELLLTALASELDPRFEQFFGYLNDDVTRRRPSAAVALTLCGESVASASARARLTHGPLITGGLVALDDAERPFPGRALRIPDRVLAHLLGDDAPDAALTDLLDDLPPVVWGDTAALTAALTAGTTALYLREPQTGSGRVLAVRALEAAGRPALILNLHRLLAAPDSTGLARIAAREARLRGAGLITGPVDETVPTAVLDALVADPNPLVLIGTKDWDPEWSRYHPLLADVPASTAAERADIWRSALNGHASSAGFDAGDQTAQFRLRPEQVVRAAHSAVVQSRLAGGRLDVRHLHEGARGENGAALQRLARRIEPGVGFDDLVLPWATAGALKELVARAHYRERVLGDWRMRPGGGRGMGVSALFAGDSGTGKTMSAEVVAGALGLDLYVIDLSSVIDKYVGETEKNLEKIFTAAVGVNGVLLFDEADAVFGKRSEVKDAHDRYANVESAYLLQRMESFDGLAILSTNLRSNIDDAFTRRLDLLIDFPVPDAEQRAQLWDRCLGRTAPRADGLDLAFLARSFELAGGAIRSSAVTAAYLAAEDGQPISMQHLVRSVQSEYRKMGRLVLQSEFGEYYPLLATSG
jgi:hypothetical protein